MNKHFILAKVDLTASIFPLVGEIVKAEFFGIHFLGGNLSVNILNAATNLQEFYILEVQ